MKYYFNHETKICTRCGAEKPLSEFTKDKRYSLGVTSRCKICTNEMKNKWRSDNKDKVAEWTMSYRSCNGEKIKEGKMKYHLNNLEKVLLGAAKARAKRSAMEFNLDVCDIIIPEVCPLLGVKLEVGGGIKNRWNSPSLDRIDNTKGYVKGNVWVISDRANRIKKDSTINELTSIVENWKKYEIEHKRYRKCEIPQKQQVGSSREIVDKPESLSAAKTDNKQFMLRFKLFYSDKRKRDPDGSISTIIDTITRARRRLVDLTKTICETIGTTHRKST